VSRSEPPHRQARPPAYRARPPQAPERPSRGPAKAPTFDRGFQFRYALDETSHQSSMLSQLFSTDVELLIEICHLVLQILNQRAILFDLSLRPRLRPAVVQLQEDAAVRSVPRKGILSRRHPRASELIPSLWAVSLHKLGRESYSSRWCTTGVKIPQFPPRVLLCSRIRPI